jgi:glyoxylase-like metal-dependent hydrolase (beta-lactamase superfamily II)
MTARITQILVGQMANFTYILADVNSHEAALIDPSWELEKIFATMKKNTWEVRYIINTHTHFDHVLGNEQAGSVTGAKIIQHENSTHFNDIVVKDGQVISIGDIMLKIIHTPGHSKDSMCIVVNNESVFTGDTLFVGSCGRTDLPGSDTSEMYDSLFEKIANLDKSLIVYPGHDYGSTQTTTIGRELEYNQVLRPRSRAEFLCFMESADD